MGSHLIPTSGLIYRLRLLYSPHRLCESQFQDFLMLVVSGIWLDNCLLCVCRWRWGLSLVLQDVQQCCRPLPTGCQHQLSPPGMTANSVSRHCQISSGNWGVDEKLHLIEDQLIYDNVCGMPRTE